MDERNGDIFEHHEDLFPPISTSDSEHDCLKEFLLEPSGVHLNNALLPPVSSVYDNGQMGLVPCELRTLGQPVPVLVQGVPFTGAPVPLQNALIPSPVLDRFMLTPTHGQSGFVDTSSQGYLDPLVQSRFTEAPVQTPAGFIEFQSPGHSGLGTPDTRLPVDVVNENGDCWSPDVEAGTSERTVSSDCVSSEAVCSPGEGAASNSPSPAKVVGAVVPTDGDQTVLKKKTRGRKRKTEGEVVVKERKASRGRPPKTTVTTYQSQIAPNENGLKLLITKSNIPVTAKPRKRKPKEPPENDYVEPAEQSGWGDRIPEEVLHEVFLMVTHSEGSVPFLCRMSRVCRLWHGIAMSPDLWHHVDLASTWVNNRNSNYYHFTWLCDNRLERVHDLNLGGFVFDGVPGILEKMAETCGQLRGLGLNSWQRLTADDVKFLLASCPHLQRIDMSAISPEGSNPKGAVSLASLIYVAQTMGERLTHLVLSSNTLAGISQVVQAIAMHCPNLRVLDLSNVRTSSLAHAHVHIERLQEGCQLLRVLRIANSMLCLSAVSLKEQGASKGFPELEELSVAGGTDNGPVMDDEALNRIVKASQKLRLLDVRNCQRVSDSSLVRVPAWDLEHLFLSGCYVTRVNDSGLELIAQKWSHSLVEVDLAWSTATVPLDGFVTALAEQAEKSQLRVLNLCGSSVNLAPVKAVLTRCPHLASLNLSSCRALPRGMKRLYEGTPLVDLKQSMLQEATQQDT